jgi:hypothetical protein
MMEPLNRCYGGDCFDRYECGAFQRHVNMNPTYTDPTYKRYTKCGSFEDSNNE